MTELVAIYTRISSDREGLEHGVVDQERSCREFAERLGLAVHKVYSDNNISASRKSRRERPAFEQMMKDARSGAFHHILALSQSRLTRRPREFEDLIELFEETGVRIRTLKSGDYDLSTADGRAQARNNANWDTLEAERTSERVKAAVDRRAREGVWHGGTTPYGYNNLGKQLVINDEEAAMILEAAKRILAGDTGYSIVYDWNGRGSRTRKGAYWRESTLRTILKNRTLIGETKTGHKGQWEAILDRRTFDRLQKHYAAQPRHTQRTPQSRGGKYSLSGGIARCAKCGSIMVGSIRRYANAPEKDRPIMACNQAHNADLKCGDTTIDFKRLEAHVFNRVISGLMENDRWKKRSSEPDPNNDAKISALEARREDIQDKRKRLLSLRLRDAISEDEFVEERSRINTELENVARDIDALLDTTVLTDAIRDGLDWRSWSPMRRRNFLKALIKEVKVGGYPRKIEDITQHTEESDESFKRRIARLTERYPNGFPNNVNRKPGESDTELQRRRDQLHADTIEARADIITN